MKIALIYGQNHKGSTYHIARMLAEKLEGEMIEFFLPRDFSEYCTGCTACFKKTETLCPHYKTLLPITTALDQADVIILASPVYVYHVTGAMKAFLDHYGYRWLIHRPEETMFQKQAVCISTAAGGGMKRANQDMADSMFFWGIGKIHKYGVRVFATSYQEVSDKIKQKIEKRTTKLANKIKKTHGNVKVGIKTKIYFYFVRMLQKREWNPVDGIYWNEKGWNQKKRPWKIKK